MGAVPLNGHVPASELGTVEGLPLALKTINAYLRMKDAAKAAGVGIWIAQPIGGYRSFAVQADMKVNPAKYGLSTVSTVNIASAGYSTHGLGNALDIGSFGSAYGTAGAKRSDWLIKHAPEFGFYREFGDRDPNHFHHDGFTGVDPIITLASTGVKPIAPAPPPPPPPIPRQDIDMIAFTAKDLLPGWNFVISPGLIKNAPKEEAVWHTDITGSKVHALTNERVRAEIWNHGLGEYIDGSDESLKNFLLSLGGGRFVTASWLGGHK